MPTETEPDITEATGIPAVRDIAPALSFPGHNGDAARRIIPDDAMSVLIQGWTLVQAAAGLAGRVSVGTGTVVTRTAENLPEGWSIDAARNACAILWTADDGTGADFSEGTSPWKAKHTR